MDNENVIDLGVWKTPKGWDELTLKQFQAIDNYYSDKDKSFDVRDVLELFTDHSREEVEQLPIDFVSRLLNELVWLSEAPDWGEPSNTIEIDGERYSINIMEKLKTGEFIAVDTILKANPKDYISILAVLCRKEGEVYDSKFEAEVFDQRVELFGKQPITKVMPLVNFFLNCYIVQKIHSQLYSELEEGLNLIQRNIDNSEKLGVFKKRYLNWRMKKLRKLLKSNKST